MEDKFINKTPICKVNARLEVRFRNRTARRQIIERLRAPPLRQLLTENVTWVDWHFKDLHPLIHNGTPQKCEANISPDVPYKMRLPLGVSTLCSLFETNSKINSKIQIFLMFSVREKCLKDTPLSMFRNGIIVENLKNNNCLFAYFKHVALVEP